MLALACAHGTGCLHIQPQFVFARCVPRSSVALSASSRPSQCFGRKSLGRDHTLVPRHSADNQRHRGPSARCLVCPPAFGGLSGRSFCACSPSRRSHQHGPSQLAPTPHLHQGRIWPIGALPSKRHQHRDSSPAASLLARAEFEFGLDLRRNLTA